MSFQNTPDSDAQDSWRTIVSSAQCAIQGDTYWEQRLAGISASNVGIHVAIFIEPYLSYVLSGRKTVESRFGMRRYAPYGKASRGDVIFLKRSSGPILGICEVEDIWFYHLDLASWQSIQKTFTEALCAQGPDFWRARSHASFATLMSITAIRPLPPIKYAKRDRRGWVVLKCGDFNPLGSV
jgi:hypothetical protein